MAQWASDTILDTWNDRMDAMTAGELHPDVILAHLIDLMIAQLEQEEQEDADTVISDVSSVTIDPEEEIDNEVD